MARTRHSSEQIIAKVCEAEVLLGQGRGCPRCLSGWGRGTDVLPLMEGVRRAGGQSGQKAQGVGEAGRPAEESGGGPEPG